MTRRPNDVGGREAGDIDTAGREPKDWQKRLSALVSSLGPAGRNIYCIDEFRRTREDLPEDFYNSLTYFELWTQGLSDLLIEKGVLTREEIDARTEALRRRLDG